MNRLPIKPFALAGLLLATPVFAQSPAAPPPCSDPVYRAFDFWVGKWDVSTPDGKTAGVNRIEKAEAGCLLVERWSGAGGSTGQSLNFYDPGLQQWRQVWVSPGAVIDYAGGINDDGEMVLEGEIRYHAGQTAPFRGVWTPLPDGRVRQHFDQFDAESETWQAWFTGVYQKRPE